MAEELRLWAMDGAGGATLLTHAGQTASEELLERTLLNNPKMVDEDLEVVGRQITVPGGRLDLLGVNGDGRLVVFELKRGTLTRDAVGQIIDYASYLDNLDDAELANFIARNSGHHGTEKIDDFNAWYAQQEFSADKDLSSLRPVQITLVGLGVDPNADRMVRYLANGGMGISLLTFSGYHHSGQTLLARQVQVEALETIVENSQSIRRPKVSGSLKDRVIANVGEWREGWQEGCDLFDTVRDMFLANLPGFNETGARGKFDWAPYRLIYHPPSKWGKWVHKMCAVQLIPWRRNVEVIFFPLALQRCADEFARINEEFPFRTLPPNMSERDAGVEWLMFDLKTMADWELHQDKLTAVTQAVYEASADLRRE